jgi:hypothetical protein
METSRCTAIKRKNHSCAAREVGSSAPVFWYSASLLQSSPKKSVLSGTATSARPSRERLFTGHPQRRTFQFTLCYSFADNRDTCMHLRCLSKKCSVAQSGWIMDDCLQRGAFRSERSCPAIHAPPPAASSSFSDHVHLQGSRASAHLEKFPLICVSPRPILQLLEAIDFFGNYVSSIMYWQICQLYFASYIIVPT